MAKQQFLRLSLSLLDGGVAYRHVRRFIEELNDHFEDLKAESLGKGGHVDLAEAEAASKLGDQDLLVQKMLQQPELKSYGRRPPLAMMVFGPVLLQLALLIVSAFIMIAFVQVFDPEFISYNTDKAVVGFPTLAMGVLNAVRLFMMYLLPLLVVAAAVIYATRNHIALKYYGSGLLIACLLGCSIYTNLQWPDPANNIEGSLSISIALVRLIFPPDYLFRLGSCLLLAWLCRKYILFRMHRDFSTP